MKIVRTLMRIVVVAVTQGLWTPAMALDYQIHGFAAQGYLLSEGNNFFGDSTNGSYDLYEAALNGSLDFGHGLLASAQVLIRDAGLSDDGKPRLDYGLIDWRALQSVEATAGVRLGRVKNPLGLYNDTRDVVFARPGILLPQSVYFDGVGLRSLFFSSDGAQLYGSLARGSNDLSLTFSAALDRDLNAKEKEVLTSGGPQPDEVRLKELFFTRLANDWNGGRAIFSLSHTHARLTLEPTPSFPVSADISFNLYVASARYNTERYSITGEYGFTRTRGRTSIDGRTTSASDGAYLQADYRIAPHWAAFARYDARFSDAHDRDGRDSSDRYSQFAHDLTLGGSWIPDEHWGLWAEVHRIYGTATAPALDNPDGADDPHWTLLTLMAGYRF